MEGTDYLATGQGGRSIGTGLDSRDNVASKSGKALFLRLPTMEWNGARV